MSSKYHITLAGKAPDNTTKYIKVDFYDIAEGANIVCPAQQHACKKLFYAGNRGHKDRLKDLYEARESLSRAIEMEEERCRAASSTAPPMVK